MKKLLNWVVAVTLLIGVIGIGGANSKVQAADELPFKDVSTNAWYYSYVKEAVDRGIISGYPNGTFKPNDPVTVAEFLKIVILSYTDDKTFGFTYWSEKQLEYAPDWKERTLFDSVETFQEGNPWYINYLNTADNLGMIVEGEFVGRYNEPLTRERASHIIENIDEHFHGTFQPEYSMYAGPQFFKDFNKTDMYYQISAANVALRGIMLGNDQGYFNPKAYISRAETAKISELLFDPTKRTEKTPKLNGVPYATVSGPLGFDDRIHIFANQEMLENFKLIKDRQANYQGYVSDTLATLQYFKDEEAKHNQDYKSYFNFANDPNVYLDMSIGFDTNVYSILLKVDKDSYQRAKAELKYFIEKVYGQDGTKVFTEIDTAFNNALTLKEVKVDKVILGRQLVISNTSRKVVNIGISGFSDL